MKRYLLFLCTLLVLTACTNTIGYLPDDEPKRLVVNAMMEAGNDDNRIYLHYTGWMASTPATDGIIRLYINEKLTETITAEAGYYPVKSKFCTGDKVRIEAETENGAYRVNAETVVHAPLQILQVDTSYVKLRDYDSWIGDEPAYDNYLRLQIRSKQLHANAENTFYRLEVQQIYFAHKWYYGYYGSIDSLRVDTTYNYNYIFDTALMDGKPGQSIDDGFELIQKWNNSFGLFKNTFFKEGEYTLTIDLKEDINFIHFDSDKAERDISIRLYSISEEEYKYLHAMSAAIDFDADNFIYAVPLIPFNIQGGIGIFSITSKAEYKLREEDLQYKS